MQNGVWSYFLSQFPFKVLYRSGSENLVADALSRLPEGPIAIDSDEPPTKKQKIMVVDEKSDRDDQSGMDHKHSALAPDFDSKSASISESKSVADPDSKSAAPIAMPVKIDFQRPPSAAWTKAIRADPYFSRIYDAVLKQDGVDFRFFAKKYPNAIKKLSIAGDDHKTLLYEHKALVPHGFRTQLIALFHNMTHRGGEGTAETLRQTFFWPGLSKDVADYVKRCIYCQVVKASTGGKL
jgi:hypothetical protein